MRASLSLAALTAALTLSACGRIPLPSGPPSAEANAACAGAASAYGSNTYGTPMVVAAVDADVPTLIRIESAADGGPNDPYPAGLAGPGAWQPNPRVGDRVFLCYLDGRFEQAIGEPGMTITRIVVGDVGRPDGSGESRILAVGTSRTLPLPSPQMPASGAELIDVSRNLGHADLSTTADVCAHFTRDMQRRSAEQMDGILGGRLEAVSS